jgi:hypothetical protein
MRKPSLLSALTLALVPAVGCGDDSNESSARAGTISKQEYIARSGKICERTEQKAAAAFERIVGQEHPTPGHEQAFMAKAQRFFNEAVIPAMSENVNRRRALPARKGDERKIEAIIAAGEEALARFKDVAADRTTLQALFEEEIPDPAKEFDDLSRSYGIDKCGGGQ